MGLQKDIPWLQVTGALKNMRESPKALKKLSHPSNHILYIDLLVVTPASR